MRIVLQNVLGLLVFVAYQYLCLAKDHVTIGVLVNEFQTESMTVLNSTLDQRYSVEIQQVSSTDSYEASKTLCNMLSSENGVGAVFGSDSSITTPILESICSNFEVPYIMTSWRDTNYNSNKFTLNFYPEAYLFSFGLAQIVKNLQWNSFVIIYETEEGLLRMQEILKLQEFQKNGRKNNIIVKQLGPGPDYRPLLKNINNTDGNIILDCKTENIIPFLQQAQSLKMLSLTDNYFLTSLDAHTLNLSILDTTANITTIRLFDYNTEEFQSAVGMSKSIKTKTALFQDALTLLTSVIDNESDNDGFQISPISCDVNTKFEGGIGIRNQMKSKSIPSGLTGPIVFDDCGNRIDFNIYVVEITNDQIIAIWSAKNQEITLTRTASDTIDAAIANIRNATVIVSSRLGPPYLMENHAAEGEEELQGNARYRGYSMDLIAGIAKIIGFKFEFRLAADKKYGNWDEKENRWTGLVGDLLEKRAQLAVCDLTITHERREVVDFSMPFMTLGISILYKESDKKDINMFAFLDPFHVTVWVYTATLYLVISVVLYIISRMTPGDWENPHPCEENPEELENIWGIKNCLWLTLGSIMTQGCDILPKGISSRMAVSMWWFFSLIMTSSYTANLAAFLTRANLEAPIDSAEALAKQTKIKYGLLEKGSTETFFRTSNFSLYQRMWTNMKEAKPSVFVSNNDDGVARVQSTKNALYAFLMESTGIEYQMETKCDLKQIGLWLDTKSYGIAMPINAPYRSLINKAVLKMQESGDLGELKKLWWKTNREEPSCDTVEKEEESDGSLALANVGGVFLVLGVGVALAFVLATMEFLWNVRNVSVEEHLTYWEALKIELKFACNIWITKKRTKPLASESSSSKQSEKSHKTDDKSILQSILHSTASSMNIKDSLNNS